MKYDRPVWQLMHACADAMPETFRYPEVRAWFAEHFPEVGEATIRAHIVGLTEGGATKHAQFERRSPVFRRVERGLYAAIPIDERGESPDDADSETESDDAAPPERPWVAALLGRSSHADDDLADDDDDVTAADDEMDEDDVAIVDDDFIVPTMPDDADLPPDAPAAPAEPVQPEIRRGSLDRWRRGRPASDADQQPSYRQIVAAERERMRAEHEEADVIRRAEAEAARERRAVEEADRRRLEAAARIEAEQADIDAQRAEVDRIRRDQEREIRQGHTELAEQRRQLEVELAELAKVSAERAVARQAANDAIAAERANLVVQEEKLREAQRAGAEARTAAVRAMEAERVRLAQEQQRAEQLAVDLARDEISRLTEDRVEAERAAASATEALRRAKADLDVTQRDLARAEAERLELLRRDAARAEEAAAEAMRLRDERDETERLVKAERKRVRKLLKAAERASALAEEIEQDLAQQAELEAAKRAVVDDEAAQVAAAEREAAAAVRIREEIARAEQEALDRFRPTEAPDVPAPTREEREAEVLHAEEQQHVEALRAKSSSATLLSDGGAYIVRAPRIDPDADDADDAAEPVESSTEVRRRLDAVLIGSDGERVAVPAPAKDAFRDLQFQLARFDAEASGARWFVLSGEHGLLEPDEWISPDDESAESLDDSARGAWAGWVVSRLASQVGPLNGKVIQIDAPDALVEAVTNELRREGAAVAVGAPSPDPTVVSPLAEPADEPVAPPVVEDDEPVVSAGRAQSIAEHLTDDALAVPSVAARGLPHQPGLYAWLVDATGAAELASALGMPVEAGALYVGQVGASSSIGEVVGSLNDHVNLMQLHGSARGSRFRMNLATVLAEPLGLASIDDFRLTRWMLDHLSITVWPTADVDELDDLKRLVLAEVPALLNLDRPDAGGLRERLSQLRRHLS